MLCFYVAAWLPIVLITLVGSIYAFSLQLPFGGPPDAAAVKEKYEELARLADRSDGECWRNALFAMRSQCQNLDETSHARFGLHLTHCFLKQHGAGSIPCVETWDASSDYDANAAFNITACLGDATFGGPDSGSDLATRQAVLQVYSQFYLHTRNLCYYYASRLWQERTIATVDVLSKTTELITQTLDDNLGISRELKQDLNSFVDTTHALVAHTDKMSNIINRVVDDTSTALIVHGQILNSTISHATSFVTTIDGMVTHFMALRFMIVGYLTGLQSILFWGVFSVTTYFATCFGRTRSARIWVYLVFACNLLCELFVIPYVVLVTRNTQQALDWFFFLVNVPDGDVARVKDFIFYCRVLHLFAAAATWLWMTWKCRDLGQENNQLLLSLKEENRIIRGMLEQNRSTSATAAEPPQGFDEGDSAISSAASSGRGTDGFGRRPIIPRPIQRTDGHVGLVPPLPAAERFRSPSTSVNNNSLHTPTASSSNLNSRTRLNTVVRSSQQRAATPLSGRSSRIGGPGAAAASSNNNPTKLENDIDDHERSMDITNMDTSSTSRMPARPAANSGNNNSESSSSSDADDDDESDRSSYDAGRCRNRRQQRTSSRNSVAHRSVADMSFTPLKNSPSKAASFSRCPSSTGGGSAGHTPGHSLIRTASGTSPYSLRDTPSRQRAAANHSGSASPLRAAAKALNSVISTAVSALARERIDEEEIEEPVMDGRESKAAGDDTAGFDVFSDDDANVVTGSSSSNQRRLRPTAVEYNVIANGHDTDADNVQLNNTIHDLEGVASRNRVKAEATVRHRDQLPNVFSSDEEQEEQ